MRKFKINKIYILSLWMVFNICFITLPVIVTIFDSNNDPNNNIFYAFAAGNFLDEVKDNGMYRLLDKKLDNDKLNMFHYYDLRIIRNTIFAKYGYIFKSEDLQKHFKQFEWYKPDKNTTLQIKNGKILSKTDKYNINMLKNLENMKKKELESQLKSSGIEIQYEISEDYENLSGSQVPQYEIHKYFLCSDGTLMSDKETLGGREIISSDEYIQRYGSWIKHGDIITLQWKVIKKKEGVGKPDYKSKKYNCAANACYGEYQNYKISTENNISKETLKWNKIINSNLVYEKWEVKKYTGSCK